MAKVSHYLRQEAKRALRDAREQGIALSPEEAATLRKAAAGDPDSDFLATLDVLGNFMDRNPRQDVYEARDLGGKLRREYPYKDLLTPEDRALLTCASRSWDVSQAQVRAIRDRIQADLDREAAERERNREEDRARLDREAMALAEQQGWVLAPGETPQSRRWDLQEMERLRRQPMVRIGEAWRDWLEEVACATAEGRAPAGSRPDRLA